MYDAPVCPMMSHQSDCDCRGKGCAWFNEGVGACSMYLLGTMCDAAVNASEGPYTGEGSRAGIIVKHAPLADDFVER